MYWANHDPFQAALSTAALMSFQLVTGKEPQINFEASIYGLTNAIEMGSTCECSTVSGNRTWDSTLEIGFLIQERRIEFLMNSQKLPFSYLDEAIWIEEVQPLVLQFVIADDSDISQ
ncbi:hypothetical protein JCGZ_27166 [Jatropha curcas]|uniref:Uncharacterized protein n=1 Tax=Jatropha curcas TaxID=180498 RepID=A0A067JIR7_JATCU|nr:hypothetical protein JCGZ_27166 [Jatropha curcas]